MINFIEKFIFLLGWLRIVFSPLALGLIVGLLTGNAIGGKAGVIVAVLIALLGLIIGIIWAEYARRKKGSMNYLGGLYATEEKVKLGSENVLRNLIGNRIEPSQKDANQEENADKSVK